MSDTNTIAACASRPLFIAQLNPAFAAIKHQGSDMVPSCGIMREGALPKRTGSGSTFKMILQDALRLFRRLGVNVEIISRAEFNEAYAALAKRFHPDVNPKAHELMANLNDARSTMLRSYRAD